MTPSAPFRRIEVLGLLGVLLLAAVIDLNGIGTKALWNDEALSFFYSLDGLQAALTAVRTDVHPPLYYLVLALWLPLGESLTAIRLLSVLAMLGATLFVYLATRRLSNPIVALLAAVIFISNPTIASWAQKARPYALQTLFVAIAYWGLAAGHLQRDLSRRWLGSGIAAALRARKWTPAATVDLAGLAYSLGGGLAMLTQLTAGFFVLGCNAAMALLILRDPEGRARRALNWIAAQCLLAALWAIWLPDMIGQYHRHFAGDGLRQAYPLDLETLRVSSMGLLSVSTVWRLLPVAFALYAACFLLAAWTARRDPGPMRYTLAVVLAPLLFCLAAYATLHSAFGHVIATFAWILVPYAGHLAFGIAQGGWRPLRLGLGALLLAMNLVGLRNYDAAQYPRLDMPADYIAQSWRAGDAFVLATNLASRWGIAYYWRAANIPPRSHYPTLTEDPLLLTASDARRHPRLWLLLPDGAPPLIPLDDIAQGRRLAAERRFDDLRVLRFDRLE